MAEPTYDELKARLEELEKKGVRRTGELDFKVGEKGGVSVYGRLPTSTLPTATHGLIAP